MVAVPRRNDVFARRVSVSLFRGTPKMKIAQIAPLVESVPPKLYGGTERVVSWLTEELVAQGHDVTLFASGDSVTAAELAPVVPRALRLNGVHDAMPYNAVMLDKVAERATEFDLLHFHIDFFNHPLFRTMSGRSLTTMHGRLDLPDLQLTYRSYTEMPVVSISNSQRKPLPHANWMGTVYHGLPTAMYSLNEKPGDYLAFLGRITPEKGPEEAIAIANRAGIPLRIAAKVDPVDREYYETVLAPLIAASPMVDYIGEINDREKQDFLGNARALLFPINWPEPFGLVMIEAFACGTPVVAFPRGSVREVVSDGINGVIVTNVDEAAASLERAIALPRASIRASFDKRFCAPVMARTYVEIYEKLTGKLASADKKAA